MKELCEICNEKHPETEIMVIKRNGVVFICCKDCLSNEPAIQRGIKELIGHAGKESIVRGS